MRKRNENMYSIFRIKRFKRALKVILMICLCIIASMPYNIEAKAAGNNTKFIGDGVGTSIHNANSMGADVFYAKYLDRNNQDDNLYNKLNVTSDLMLIFSTGKVTTGSGEAVNMKYVLSDSNGEIIWETDTTRKDKENNGAYLYQIGLKKGVYYLNIKRCGGARFTGSNKGLLLYGVSVFNGRYFETEPNNSTYTSNPILTDVLYLGNIDTNNDDYFYFNSDNYKVCISLRINDETALNKTQIYLKDIDGNEKILNFIKNGEYYKCEVENFNFHLCNIIIKPTDIIDNVLYGLVVEEDAYDNVHPPIQPPSTTEPTKTEGLQLMDGKFVFMRNGVKDATVNTMVPYGGEVFLVKDGEVDTAANGFAGYDGGKFFVAGGRVCREASGLVQDPVTKEWLFVAEGQVQQQYSGLAEYDGAWFLLKDGILQEDFTGLQLYDGAFFMLAEGRIVTEYSGLYEYQGVWYYIAEGRLLGSYTGLALYDGTWFYIREGKLDTFYTGQVEYGGNRFYVENGVMRAS